MLTLSTIGKILSEYVIQRLIYEYSKVSYRKIENVMNYEKYKKTIEICLALHNDL